MMMVADASSVIVELRRRTGALAAALVSRDGTLLSADLPEEVHGETFAVLNATILGAATAINAGLRGSPPNEIVFDGGNMRTVITSYGPASLLVLVIGVATDPISTLAEMHRCPSPG